MRFKKQNNYWGLHVYPCGCLKTLNAKSKSLSEQEDFWRNQKEVWLSYVKNSQVLWE